MTPADRRTLFRTFTEEIASIEAALARWSAFRDDAAHGSAIHSSWQQDMEDRLAGLQAATNRMDDPEYGVCQECGEDIPLKRLLAMPGATLCVACKSEQEHVLDIP